MSNPTELLPKPIYHQRPEITKQVEVPALEQLISRINEWKAQVSLTPSANGNLFRINDEEITDPVLGQTTVTEKLLADITALLVSYYTPTFENRIELYNSANALIDMVTRTSGMEYQMFYPISFDAPPYLLFHNTSQTDSARALCQPIDNITAPVTFTCPIVHFHMDVVKANPNTPNPNAIHYSEANGLLYGRGTADMKMAGASLILTLAALSKLEVDAAMLVSYDEEGGGCGLPKDINTPLLIDTEPTPNTEGVSWWRKILPSWSMNFYAGNVKETYPKLAYALAQNKVIKPYLRYGKIYIATKPGEVVITSRELQEPERDADLRKLLTHIAGEVLVNSHPTIWEPHQFNSQLTYWGVRAVSSAFRVPIPNPAQRGITPSTQITRMEKPRRGLPGEIHIWGNFMTLATVYSGGELPNHVNIGMRDGGSGRHTDNEAGYLADMLIHMQRVVQTLVNLNKHIK